MIVLDTNVLSELMKPAPAHEVVHWIAAQSAATLYTTSITEAEILHGIMLLPAGKRRAAFEAAAASVFEETFAGRVLAFGREAARDYAEIAVERRRAGRPISQLDAQIAGIARSIGAAIASRNATDFEGCGVVVHTPGQTDRGRSGCGGASGAPARVRLDHRVRGGDGLPG